MLKRTVTGACLVALTVGFFLLRTIDARFFQIYVCAIITIGGWEMASALKDKITPLQFYSSVAFAFLITPAYFLFSATGLLYLTVIYVVYLLFIFVFGRDARLETLAFSITAAVYPSLILSSLLLVNDMVVPSASGIDCAPLILVFIISPFTDTFAYFTGSLIGGKKLCPNVSPKKTVSGAIGGLVGGALGSVLLCLIIRPENTLSPYFIFAAVGLAGAVLTELGDLVESAIKRRLNVKDMGCILPGHGGVLDRVDGLMITSWFVFLVFSALRL